ncbi:MAG: diaminopimelate epimerase [Ignavibacteriales bacterium]|nr:diaminopimelate epimerase [Ignavibacteriales bacterium]
MSTTIQFTKMTGAGNDFILIDNYNAIYTHDWQIIAPILCDRRYGVGADGLLIIEKSIVADFKMNYFNSDGSYGGMCGNGGRCVALFETERMNKSEIKFEALNHIYTASLYSNSIKLQMANPHSIILNQKIIGLKEFDILYHSINTGSPHLVIFNKDFPVMNVELISLGKELRHYHRFKPSGTNVNFVTINNDRSIFIRTYERGVEAETFACGTGSIAAAIIYSILYSAKPPINVYTKNQEILTVDFDRDGEDLRNVSLTGPAKEVFKGEFILTI